MTNYSIVNGCQSTLTLYENRDVLSKNLEIPIKLVETGENTELAESITYYTNNQNPINPADLRSREKFQMDLQKEFDAVFGGRIHYNIKRGEGADPSIEVIENTFAAQLIYSFVNESPFDAHLKSSLFSKHYHEIFTRHINVFLILFLKRLFDLIEKHIDKIKDPVVRSYLPTRFFILYIIKRVLKDDSVGVEFIDSTEKALQDYSATLISAFDKLIQILIIQLNSNLEIRREGDGYIDYKNILRNSSEVHKLAGDVISGYETLLVHHPENKLSELIKPSS